MRCQSGRGQLLANVDASVNLSAAVNDDDDVCGHCWQRAKRASLRINRLRGCPVFHAFLSYSLSLAADRKYTFVFAYRFLYTHTSNQREREREKSTGWKTKIRLSCCSSAQRKIKHKIILNRNYRICSKNVTKMQLTTKKNIETGKIKEARTKETTRKMVLSAVINS